MADMSTQTGTDAPAADDAAKTQALAQVTTAIRKVNEGAISFADLLKLVAPPPPPEVAPAQPAPVPGITAEQRKALERVVEVFGKVVPTERRVLTVPEVGQLIEERMTLDAITDLAEKRKEGIRTTVCNHLDLELEAEATKSGAELPHRDDKGHYVANGKARNPDQPKQFSRETRGSSPTLDPEALRLLADDAGLQAKLAEAGITFTHADYLAMTRPVRVVDEAQVMLHLRKNPHLVHAIKLATTSKPSTASVYLRKA